MQIDSFFFLFPFSAKRRLFFTNFVFSQFAWTALDGCKTKINKSFGGGLRKTGVYYKVFSID